MIRVVFNQKGGVGKSSITCNLAAISASKGRRTLVVDLDPQGNTTHYLMGQKASEIKSNIADFFEQTLSFNLFNKDASEFVHQSPYENLSIIPSNPELEFLERKLEAKHKIYKLKSALREMEKFFDDIYIDTAPALNFYTRSALIATDTVLIPFDCDDFSRQALYQIMGELQDIQEDHNGGLKIEGIVVNQFQPRASLPQRLVEELIEEGLPVLDVKLSASVKMKESHQSCKPLIYFAPTHNLTQQFVALDDLLQGQLEEA
jgi:chromosome partitioning protein